MSIRHYVLLSVLCSAIAGACAGGLREQERMQSGLAANQQKRMPDVTLASGLVVSGVTYRKEPLGGKFLLGIKKQSGLTVSSGDSAAVPSLSDGEFDELTSELLSIIHKEHRDQLDSIQMDLALVGPLWNESVRHLRGAAIAPDHTVDPKSGVVLAAMQSYLSESALVKRVCEQVATIEKKCKKRAVSMNPVVFRSPHLWKKWSEVKDLPDAGIEKESVWFSIDLEGQ